MADAKAADTPALRRGVGIARGGYNVSSGPQDESSVAIGINEDGTFTKYDAWQDVGQGGDIEFENKGVILHIIDEPLHGKLARDMVLEEDVRQTYCRSGNDSGG